MCWMRIMLVVLVTVVPLTVVKADVPNNTKQCLYECNRMSCSIDEGGIVKTCMQQCDYSLIKNCVVRASDKVKQQACCNPKPSPGSILQINCQQLAIRCSSQALNKQ